MAMVNPKNTSGNGGKMHWCRKNEQLSRNKTSEKRAKHIFFSDIWQKYIKGNSLRDLLIENVTINSEPDKFDSQWLCLPM
jgi:hypothetical protein